MSGKSPVVAVQDAVAVIDIGTNSIRIEIAELLEGGEVRILDRARRPVFLGQDTFVSGRLSMEKLRAAIAILRDFTKMLQTYNVRHVRVLATSAVQEASNTDAFIDRVYMSTGLEVELIEPLEELRLMSISVRAELGDSLPADRPALFLEVGGGNVLASVIDQGRSIACRSFPIGAIRLIESLGVAGEGTEQVAGMLESRILSLLRGISDELGLPRIGDVYVVGGEMRFLASALSTTPGDDASQVSIKQLDAMLERCRGKSPERLCELMNLPYEESLALPAALMVYRAVLRYTSADAFFVANGSMRDGMLREISRRASGIDDPIESDAIIQTARGFVEKYHCHMAHAEHVSKLALSLFDQLKPLHGLDSRHRLLLHVAGLVHDAGTFISSRAHHKHSYYLIANSEFLGLSESEKEVVAQIARYHRRSCPKSSHRGYVVLSRHRRMVVSKLAAILRVADALDRSHTQCVRNIAVRMTDRFAHLNAECNTDMALEKQALRQKADLFHDIFGIPVQLNLI